MLGRGSVCAFIEHFGVRPNLSDYSEMQLCGSWLYETCESGNHKHRCQRQILSYRR
jgi:hypothetical protein